LSFIDREQERLENFETYNPVYVEFLFEHLLRVLLSYIAIFWNDAILDQKTELNTANSYTCLDRFARTLEEKLKHFNLDVIS